ncbi:MAG: DUF5916 domain-containing protein [Bacteroidales bacterium]
MDNKVRSKTKNNRTMKRIGTKILILLMMVMTSKGIAQDKQYITHEINGGEIPVIDGNFNDAAWKQLEWMNDFVQVEPYEGRAATQETKFKMLHSNDHLYIAIRAYDTHPDSIVNRLSRRDNMDGDQVGVQIDSYNDNRTAFSFFVSAAGVKTDWIISDDGMDKDYNWDPIWYVKTDIDSLGWKAEMKIPFTQLRFSQKGESEWGFQVQRTIYRNDEEVLWMFIPQDAGGWVSEFGRLKGMNGIEPQKETSITPYAVTKLERFDEVEENPFKASGRNKNVSAGLNGKLGVTNNLTLDMAINPDFGQVEADPSNVNLTAYETFFEEKRPFFIEGQSIMNFRLMQLGDFMMDNLFYSRRIGQSPNYNPQTQNGEYAQTPDNTDILGALKLTGKTRGGWSVGVLESMTSKEKAKISDGTNTRFETVEPLSNYFLGRAQKDFSEGETMLGGIATATNRRIEADHLNFMHDQAYTGGLNFKHRWSDRTYQVAFRGTASHVMGSHEAITRTQRSSARYYQRPDVDHISLDTARNSLSGHGGSLMFLKLGKGHFSYGAFFNWKSPGLELNDMGYQRDADEVSQLAFAQYRIWEPFMIFRNFQANINQWRVWDYGGNHLVTGGNINMNMQFKNYWGWSFGVNGNSPMLSKTALRGGPFLEKPASLSFWTRIKSDQRQKLKLSVGNNQDWDAHNNSQSTNLFAEVTYIPHNAVNISLSPSLNFQNEALQYVDTRPFNSQKRYIMASIDRTTLSMSLRMNLSLTPDLSLQYWGQPFIATGKYSDFKRITNPTADNYRNRFHTFTDEQIEQENGHFKIDENRDGSTDYTFGAPDFNVLQFKSNLVARWEYTPGSAVYLVWSQNRNGFNPTGNFSLQNDLNDLFGIYPENVLLLKLTYRLGH